MAKLARKKLENANNSIQKHFISKIRCGYALRNEAVVNRSSLQNMECAGYMEPHRSQSFVFRCQYKSLFFGSQSGVR